ncbi:MAG: TIGR00159 family protein, partial [Clostridia bacterium]|nr:TIGR00159 family protein [Clostridia bacterium]
MLEFFQSIGEFISNTAANFIWQDFLDIIFVAVIIYYVLKFIRDTRAAQLMKGIVALLILFQIAKALELQATSYLLNSTLEFGLLAIIIVFQPELRTLLERIGRTSGKGTNLFISSERKVSEVEVADLIKNIVDAVSNMSA